MRRHLGYSPEEVDRMPWWQRRMFVEGLNVEFAPPEEAESPDEIEQTDDVVDLGFQVRNVV